MPPRSSRIPLTAKRTVELASSRISLSQPTSARADWSCSSVGGVFASPALCQRSTSGPTVMSNAPLVNLLNWILFLMS